MWQAIVVGVSVVLVAGFAVAAALTHFSQPHYEQRGNVNRACELDLSRVRSLGPCTQCDGETTTINGYTLSCNHSLHYTCLRYLKDQLEDYFDPNMICRSCLPRCSTRPRLGSNKRLKNRVRVSEECAMCGKQVNNSDNSRILECRHRVHETCWQRMKETSTTCPSCMEDI